MLNKYTMVGLVVGCIISGLGVASMIDFLANPIDIMDFDDNFGVGESTTFVFQAQENSFQKLVITGNAFDVKVFTPDNEINLMIAIRIEWIYHGQILFQVRI